MNNSIVKTILKGIKIFFKTLFILLGMIVVFMVIMTLLFPNLTSTVINQTFNSNNDMQTSYVNYENKTTKEEIKKPVEVPKKTIEEFKAECVEYDYKDLMRYPSDYTNKPVKVTVRINNELNNANGYWVGFAPDAYGWYGDQYTIIYNLDTRILRDDVVTIYGTYQNVIELESGLKMKLESPLIKAEAVEFIDEDTAIDIVKELYNKEIEKMNKIIE